MARAGNAVSATKSARKNHRHSKRGTRRSIRPAPLQEVMLVVKDDSKWCHRGLVSAWFYDTLELEVFELGQEAEGFGHTHPKLHPSVRHPRSSRHLRAERDFSLLRRILTCLLVAKGVL